MLHADSDNDGKGNDVVWRIMRNTSREFHTTDRNLFVYRKREVGGRTITEYLTTSGEIDNNCGGGWFRNLKEIGCALIDHETLTRFNQPYTGSYEFYLTHLQNKDHDNG